MPKTIEDRIRQASKRRVRVNITGRTRSSTGFEVEFPEDTAAGLMLCTRTVPTKAEALSILLVKAQCAPTLNFTIKPAKKKP